MMTFKKFMSLSENLWGNIPVRGKKPSDGVGGKSMSSNSGEDGGGMDVNPSPQAIKMMRKKMKKS